MLMQRVAPQSEVIRAILLEAACAHRIRPHQVAHGAVARHLDTRHPCVSCRVSFVLLAVYSASGRLCVCARVTPLSSSGVLLTSCCRLIVRTWSSVLIDGDSPPCTQNTESSATSTQTR